MKNYYKSINYISVIIALFSYETLFAMTWISHSFSLAYKISHIGYLISLILFIVNMVILLFHAKLRTDDEGFKLFRKSICIALGLMLLIFALNRPFVVVHHDYPIVFNQFIHSYLLKVSINLILFSLLYFILIPYVNDGLKKVLKETDQEDDWFHRVHKKLLYIILHFGYLPLVLYILNFKTWDYDRYIYFLFFLLALYDLFKIYKKEFVSLHLIRVLIISMVWIMPLGGDFLIIAILLACLFLGLLISSLILIGMEWHKVKNENHEMKLLFYTTAISLFSFSILLGLLHLFSINQGPKFIFYTFIIIDFIIRIIQLGGIKK